MFRAPCRRRRRRIKFRTALTFDPGGSFTLPRMQLDTIYLSTYGTRTRTVAIINFNLKFRNHILFLSSQFCIISKWNRLSRKARSRLRHRRVRTSLARKSARPLFKKRRQRFVKNARRWKSYWRHHRGCAIRRWKRGTWFMSSFAWRTSSHLQSARTISAYDITFKFNFID